MNFYKLYPTLRQYAAEQTNVSLKLAKHVLSSEAVQRNMVFSPLSIHAVLGMIATGSTGRTQEEVLEYFKAKSCDEFNRSVSQLAKVLLADGPSLKSANGVWFDQRFTLKPRYKDILHKVYKVDAGQADFLNKAEEERRKLNMWAEERTNGLIKEVLKQGSINSLTRLAFGNAAYFRGVWESHFDKSKDYEFFLSDGSSIKAPFMTSYIRRQYVSAYDGFKVLRLPYARGGDPRSFSMYIYLPDLRDGLTSLVERVTSEPGFIENHIPREKVKLSDFLIPKFEICSNFDVSKVLKKLGVVSAFEGGLTEMVEENHENMFVSSISQKAVIKVNEKGTEAAATTFGMTVGCCAPRFQEKVEDFVADHPFMFVIREDITETLLFIGHVLNPIGGCTLKPTGEYFIPKPTGDIAKPHFWDYINFWLWTLMPSDSSIDKPTVEIGHVLNPSDEGTLKPGDSPIAKPTSEIGYVLDPIDEGTLNPGDSPITKPTSEIGYVLDPIDEGTLKTGDSPIAKPTGEIDEPSFFDPIDEGTLKTGDSPIAKPTGEIDEPSFFDPIDEGTLKTGDSPIAKPTGEIDEPSFFDPIDEGTLKTGDSPIAKPTGEIDEPSFFDPIDEGTLKTGDSPIAKPTGEIDEPSFFDPIDECTLKTGDSPIAKPTGEIDEPSFFDPIDEGTLKTGDSPIAKPTGEIDEPSFFDPIDEGTLKTGDSPIAKPTGEIDEPSFFDPIDEGTLKTGDSPIAKPTGEIDEPSFFDPIDEGTLKTGDSPIAKPTCEIDDEPSFWDCTPFGDIFEEDDF